MYTQCTNHTRWRVAVPGGTGCLGGKVEAPSARYKCEKYCESGKFLPPKNHAEKCEDCPAGTYSIRGGIRFDNWEELPAGFASYGERGEESRSGENCTSYSWRPMGTHLEAPSGSRCYAVLVYTVTMAKGGEINFSYKYPASDENLFTVEVENELCQMNAGPNEEYEGNWVPPSKADKWSTHKVKLSKGRNRVFFILVNSAMSRHTQETSKFVTPAVFIRAMEVTGIAFTQSCAKCRAGTFSIVGATKCTSCAENKYSGRASSECKDCKKRQYSMRGSATCHQRPTCSKHDYYSYWSACDVKTKKMSLQYAWIEPKICIAGVTLPKTSGEYHKCDANFCDKGMYRATSAICKLCPTGQQPINDGSLLTIGTGPANATHACKKCPPDSQPVTGLTFTKWWTMPQDMKATCIAWRDEDGNCPNSSLWLPMGNYIRSGYSVSNYFSIMELTVPGFNNKSLEYDYVGHIEFEFELSCKHKCKLLFLMESDDKFERPLVSEWNKGDKEDSNNKRKTFWYSIVHTSKTKFMWLFQHSAKNTTEGDDHVKIYSVNVTNALNSPALKCESCHVGANKKCVPCGKGKYYSVEKKRCQPCPEGQVVWRTPARSVKDCRPCGSGMVARDGQECVINFNFVSEVKGAWKKHDLRPLKGNQTAKGVHLFTTRSTEYHHVFVLSIDNQQAKNQYPLCQSNISTVGHDTHNHYKSIKIDIDENTQIRSLPSIRALVCQYTLVPPRKKNSKSLTAQPFSLGDKLVNISGTYISNDSNHAIEINKRLKKAGWPIDDKMLDVHVTYVTDVKTRNCPSGRTTLVTLRCDPKSDTNRGHLSLPPNCPEGTCDGCNYHFLWLTRHACPICNRSDYEVVKGECSSGRQTIYYYPPSFCYFDVGKEHVKITETKKCPFVSSEAEIAIIIVFVLGVTLLTLLGYCWKRNKRLEYKYMKLVEGAGSRAGELPQAESCAVHEGEDDEEDVHIKSGRSGMTGSSAFFTRFKNFRKTNSHDDSMETVNLTDRDEFGL